MKILSGQYRGRNFYMPAGIKPTQGLLRAAIFDLLGQDMEGLSFLELYAGSGAVSLEAISRGAGEVVMVEKDPKNADVIRENCRLIGIELGSQFRLINADALAVIKDLKTKNKRFDIVFFDPPFDRKLAKKTLKVLNDNDILHGQSLVVAQYDKSERLEVPQGFKILVDRFYGTSHLTILQRVANNG
jgi:16S rRNA (guanine966-N2)-methyltransferase